MQFIGLSGEAPLNIRLHTEHHFFEFRIAMTALRDPGENHRISYFDMRGLKIGTLIVHDTRTLFGVDLEGTGDVELNRLHAGADRAQEVFAERLTDEKRGDGFQIKVDTDPAFRHVRPLENNSLGRTEDGPAVQRIKFHSHGQAFWIRSCGTCATTCS